MPGGGFKKRALIVGAKVRDMMEIPYRKVQRDMASGCAKPSFMTSLLEKMTQDGCLSAEEEYDIKASCLVMYTAGSDTTITSLMTFILAMVLHPHVLDKAQAEIDRVIGSERLPELDDREALPYVDCIVKEVYRWNPPVPLGKQRDPKCEVSLTVRNRNPPSCHGRRYLSWLCDPRRRNYHS